MRVELQIPDDVTADVDHLDLTVEGPNGAVTRRLWYPDVSVDVEDEMVVISSDADDAKTTATVGTFESHVQNMFHGVTEGWEYEVVIENFLGEKAPRRTTIHGDTDVSVDGEELTISGADKEAVGQTAADIEQLTKVSGKDTRVFQDGVYITQKPRKGGA